jgi:hypothetical protein
MRQSDLHEMEDIAGLIVKSISASGFAYRIPQN